LIVGWCGQFFFFVVPREWRENQILIPNWTYFHCRGATLLIAPTTAIGEFKLSFLAIKCLVTRQKRKEENTRQEDGMYGLQAEKEDQANLTTCIKTMALSMAPPTKRSYKRHKKQGKYGEQTR